MLRYLTIIVFMHFAACKVWADGSRSDQNSLLLLLRDLPSTSGFFLGNKDFVNSDVFRGIVSNPDKYHQDAINILEAEGITDEFKSVSTIFSLCLESELFLEYLSVVLNSYKEKTVGGRVLESVVIVPFNYSDVILSRMQDPRVREVYLEILRLNVSHRLNRYIKVFLQKKIDEIEKGEGNPICNQISESLGRGK